MTALVSARRRWLALPVRLCGSTFAVAAMMAVFAHFVIHAATPDIATRDDADQYIFAKHLALGYHEQPPLYTWLVWAAFQVTGPSLVAFAAVKTLVFACVVAAAWAAARATVADPAWRGPAAAGAVFLPSLAWHTFTYLTHSNLLLMACYATVAVAVRLGRSRRTRDYLLLGAAVGLGGLAKYNYAHFAAALLLAGLTVPAYRAALLNRRILLAGAVAGLIVLPHAWWLAGNWADVWPVITDKFGTDGVRSGLGRTAGPALQVAVNLLLLVGPLLVVAWRTAPESLREFRRPAGDPVTLLVRTFAVGLGAILLFAATGAERMHERWLVPVAAVAPLAVFGRATGSPRRANIVAGVVTVALVLAAAGQTVAGVGPFRGTDAAALNDVAKAAGPGGVIVANQPELAGALAYRFPDVTVVSTRLRAYRPEWRGGRVVIAWIGPPAVPHSDAAFAAERYGRTVPPWAVPAVAESPASRVPGGVVRINTIAAEE